MEIERKFLVNSIPFDLSDYPCRFIEQGYLSTDPVVRVRQHGEEYYLTYKSKGLLSREEYNLPLGKESYKHLIQKADGIVITKNRYEIPIYDKYTIELDIFEGYYKGLIYAEVEFESEEEAVSFVPPDWFGKDVTKEPGYSNSNLSKGTLKITDLL